MTPSCRPTHEGTCRSLPAHALAATAPLRTPRSPRPYRRYIQTFQAGFDEGLARVPVYFMQSDGGLTSVSDFSGHKAILSGPAGDCRARGEWMQEKHGPACSPVLPAAVLPSHVWMAVRH